MFMLHGHEVIFKSKMTVAELRDWEKQGLISGVDDVVTQLKNDDKLGTGSSRKSELRSSPESGKNREDENTQIDILISYTLFPLYKGDKYIDNQGQDRSKDEVECIMIKAKNADKMLLLDRNPFACQEKAFILAGFHFIPGEFWPISVFEITEKLLQHYEDIFNLIQDGANKYIYPKEIYPDTGIDPALLSQDGVGIKIPVPNDMIRDGVIPQYMQIPNSVLADMYSQRDNVNELIQEVTAITDFVRGVTPQGDKPTATQIREMSQRVSTRFQQSAIRIEASLMKPIWEWLMVMMSEFSDDEQVAKEMGLAENPFKQLYPVMPNPAYKIKLTGALRAAESLSNQAKLTELIELSKDLEPMPDPDDPDKLIILNTTAMVVDKAKMSGLPDVDKYKLPIPVPPELIEDEDEPVAG